MTRQSTVGLDGKPESTAAPHVGRAARPNCGQPRWTSYMAARPRSKSSTPPRKPPSSPSVAAGEPRSVPASGP